MSPDPFLESIVTGISRANGLLLLFGSFFTLAAGGAATLLIHLSLKKKLRIRKLAELLPFRTSNLDGDIIHCDDGRLVTVIEFIGADGGAINHGELDRLWHLRKGVFDAEFRERGKDIEIKIIQPRRRISGISAYDDSHMPAIIRRITRKFNQQFENIYNNRFFMVMSVSGKKRQAKDILIETRDSVVNMLSAFRPRVLKSVEGLGEDSDNRSDHLAFWQSYLSSRNVNALSAQTSDLHNKIGNIICGFNEKENGIITFEEAGDIRYMSALGIKVWPQKTKEAFVEDLLTLPMEMMLLHQIRTLTGAEAEALIKARAMMAGSRMSQRAAEEYAEASDLVSDTATAEYQLTIFVYGDSKSELKKNMAKVQQMASNNYYINLDVEGAVIEKLWLAGLPGKNFFSKPGCYMPSSNLADLIRFYRSDPGMSRSDFGEGPIMTFKTSLDEPYNFTFHISEEKEALGNVLILGRAGSGKTYIGQLLSTAATRFENLKVYIFDSLNGTYINTTSNGGKAWTFAADEEVSDSAARLNPLQMEMNETNVDFLERWIATLGKLHGDKVELKDRREGLLSIKTMLRNLVHSTKSRRSLAYVYNAGIGRTTYLGKNLRRWINPNDRGNIFNGKTDSLSLDEGRIISFDMTNIADDDEMAEAAIPYFMHRINDQIRLTAHPYIIFFEETAHMLRIPGLVTPLKKELQQGRKRRGVAILAFQNPQTIFIDEEVADIVMTNVKTHIIFPDTSAEAEHYKRFNLQDHEWAFIKGVHPAQQKMKRPILIRKEVDGRWMSTIVEGDLKSPLGELFYSMKSGNEFVRRAKDLQRAFPDGWFDRYINEAPEIEKMVKEKERAA